MTAAQTGSAAPTPPTPRASECLSRRHCVCARAQTREGLRGVCRSVGFNAPASCGVGGGGLSSAISRHKPDLSVSGEPSFRNSLWTVWAFKGPWWILEIWWILET